MMKPGRVFFSVVSGAVAAFALAAGALSGVSHAQDPVGSIQVTLTPELAVALRAQWQVDGGAFVDSGAILNGLSVGEHQVCFQSIKYFTRPVCRKVLIEANEVLRFSAAYTPQTSGVTVAITPPEAVAAGAQWRVGNGNFQNSGATVSGLFIGQDHSVTFRAIPGWITPAEQGLAVDTIDLVADQVRELKAEYVRLTGGVRVSISPQAAVNAGAQWQLDSGVFQNSGATLTNVTVGNHTISFKAIPGWVTPLSQAVSVKENTITNANGVYAQQTGSITVTLQPEEAVAAGAQWQVDGGPFQNSGARLDGVTVGARSLSFKTVDGFVRPANRNVTIVADQLAIETATYLKETGGIRVTLTPEDAVANGARWRVDGGNLLVSGATAQGLSLGEHVVSFTDAEDFVTPPEQTVIVTANQVAQVTGAYQPRTGSVLVNITPASANVAGARWRLDGGTPRESGTEATEVSIGEHTISFVPVEGYDTPPSQTISVAADQRVTLDAAYAPQFGNLSVTILPAAAIAAGAQWKVDGGPFRNSGDLVEGLTYGAHTVSFKAVTGFATPGNQSIFIRANETTRVTGNYTTQTGGLSVSLTPAAAVKAGAQWQVDDGPFKNNGTVADGLSVGSHIVFFKTIEGFDAPPFQVVTVNPDVITTAVGAYTPQTGSLTVELAPSGAVVAGAQWQVNGGSFRNSGATATGLPVGEHTLSFKNVLGFARPGNQTITIRAGQTTSAAGNYSNAIGDLRVTLSPSGAVAAGAQWQVDGGEFQNSGATVKGLSAGAHILSFKPVSGFPTPPDKTVVISLDQVTNATGEYALQNGGLTVTLTPASAVAAGAQWRVDDGPYQNSGTTVNRLTAEQHTISFKNIPGFETPDDQTITIMAGQANTATGAYRPLTGGLTVTLGPADAVAAGAQWQVDGGPFQNSGATVSGLSEGPRLVRFKAVPGFDVPEDQSVNIVAGENASLNVAYGQQTGSISVTINPASAVDAGARWRVDNGPEQESGTTLDGVPAGNRLVTFSPVPGFAAPAAQTVSILKGEVAFVTATYGTSGACCAGGAPVKSIEDAIKHYLGDFTLFLAALATLVAMGRASRWRMRG